VIKTMAILREQMEEARMRGYETDHRLRYLEYQTEPVFEFVNLMFEATEAEYQERLNILGVDGIGKYTLSEVESCRFMTKPQFDVLRSSK